MLPAMRPAMPAHSENAKAIGYYERALEIEREIKDRPDEGATLNNLGIAYRSLSQSEKAHRLFRAGPGDCA